MEALMLEKPRSRTGLARAEARDREAAVMARLAEAIKRAKPAMDRITDVDAFLEEFKEGFHA